MYLGRLRSHSDDGRSIDRHAGWLLQIYNIRVVFFIGHVFYRKTKVMLSRTTPASPALSAPWSLP